MRLNWESLTLVAPPTSNLILALPTIGTVNKYAIKKGKSLRTEESKKIYLTIPYQFIAFLVGLIDGGGYFQITRTTKGYISIKLVIILHINDLSTLEYILSVLKLGKLTTYKDYKSPICKLVISKTDLQEIFFPLLVHHRIFFLTETRSLQFWKAMYILKNEIKLFDEVKILISLNSIREVFNLLQKQGFSSCGIPSFRRNILSLQLPNPLDYLNLAFFKNWLIGFTVSEGSFFVKSEVACYQIKQRIHGPLFEAFRILFKTNRKLYTEKIFNPTSPDSGEGHKLTLGSRNDIQTVVDFFSFSGLHPLVGLKSIQYFT